MGTQTIASSEAAEHTAPYLSTIADAILTLDYTPQAYEMNRTMRVVKMRGSAHDTHPYRLEIDRDATTGRRATPNYRGHD